MTGRKIETLEKYFKDKNLFQKFIKNSEIALKEIDEPEKAVDLLMDFYDAPTLKKIPTGNVHKVIKEESKKDSGEMTDERKKEIEKDFKFMLEKDETLKMMFADADLIPEKKIMIMKAFEDGG